MTGHVDFSSPDLHLAYVNYYMSPIIFPFCMHMNFSQEMLQLAVILEAYTESHGVLCVCGI